MEGDAAGADTRGALPGIVTGVLLALARISGETAPLLFTAFSNQFWSTDLTGRWRTCRWWCSSMR
jgi:ABC-type phosphate transport system permease subunit